MAEENEGRQAGAAAPGGAGIDPAAVALALGSASRAKADEFLTEQIAVTRLQKERLAAQDRHFHEEAALELSHLRLRRFSGWAKAAFEFSAGLIALVLAAILAFTVWNAAHSEGLIIESFAVPPDLAARGFTGEVVAGQVLDRLAAMQAATDSGVTNQGYSGGSGDDIKVEIPETGISIGELYRFLRRWLGHETHIGGEVVHTATGLAITVRAGTTGADTAAGAETDLDTLLQKTAENIYRRTQPYLYVRYIVPVADPAAGAPRLAEARAILAELIHSSRYQALAWNMLGIISRIYEHNDRKAVDEYSKAITINPIFVAAFGNRAGLETRMGHAEDALTDFRAADRLRVQDTSGDQSRASSLQVTYQAQAAALMGDYGGAFALMQRAMNMATLPGLADRGLTSVQWLSLQHDVRAARAYVLPVPPPAGMLTVQPEINRLVMATTLENWAGIVAMMPTVEKAVAAQTLGLDPATTRQAVLQPALALARAKLGDIAGAESLIAATPGDCYDCVRIRGQIAGEAKQWARADFWFARAVHDAPSIPFAHEDWGRSLLARGKPDEAIAQFTLSNKKGPHFADPLEGWGEALMAKNQSHLALAKFKEAEKYAPNWGRLHLKWGEALYYAGKKDEARAQFARAATLDLTPSEKAELAKVSHG